MHYSNEAIIATLKAAREASGISQRDLSAKAGVPQSHISKIESGGTDIRLSSLIELARALDLELTLVPRKLLPAVEGILRTTATAVEHEPRLKFQDLRRAEQALAVLNRSIPDASEFGKLQQTLRELNYLRLSRNDLVAVRRATERLIAAKNEPEGLAVVRKVGNELQNLRHRIAHGITEPQRPAYSLEEEDDA